MVTENLSTLKIHNLTKEQYERELEAGRIDENALYLTPYEQIQPNWSQTDETASDFIKNKPDENDAIQLVIETELISPIALASGEILLDKNNTLLSV